MQGQPPGHAPRIATNASFSTWHVDGMLVYV